MNISMLNKRIDVWGRVAEENNELNEAEYVDTKKKTIWCAIIPQTSKLQLQTGQAGTVLSKSTHKVVCRYSSGKDISHDMWFMYKDRRMDIDFILNPYEKNETLELFCHEVIE